MTQQQQPQYVRADRLTELVKDIFTAAGLTETAASTVAECLVEADLEGVHSHGVMLVDMYVDRLRAGSVSLHETALKVVDDRAVAVLDARHALGQLIGEEAMALAVQKAKAHGAGVVAVRRAFHFGTAGRYARAAAEEGCVGIVMSNTRPLMPAPGGAERVVGNNPVAVSVPVAGDIPFVLDLAMSEAAMGKIRLAASAGTSIPPTWATGPDGTPTTDPEVAIGGMLLPVGGAKGFGLALMIDTLAGLLSSGAWGDQVRPLYGDPSIPYDCSQLFMAIDVSAFRALDEFKQEAAKVADRVRRSARAPGVERLYVPGESKWENRRRHKETVPIETAVLERLLDVAESLALDVHAWRSPA